jgi:MFS transporter, DHA2 family, multidrug resistance protein
MEEQPRINPWIIAITVMFSTFLEVLDTTVVNVSLPHIAGSLSATPEEATWALTSYLVANAIVLPLTGWLASYFGRRRLLMLAVTGFTTTSLLCGLAPSLALLVVFRLIQGLTGGVLQPMSQAVMLEAFPVEKRGKAMGFWGLGIVVAPILGPVLGGWLTDNYSWRWVFYINVPVGIISVLMTRAFIFDPPYLKEQKRGIDGIGIGLLALGIGALQFVLDKGQQDDWFSSNLILTLTVVSVVALIAFIIHALRAPNPVLDLYVFKDRTYSTGVFLMTVLGFVLYGSLVLLPIFLQTVLGYPALQAGIAMAPRGIGSFIAMPVIGMLIGKIDPRKMLGAGLLVGAFTLFELSSINLQAGYWDIFWPQFIQGLSMGLLFVPLSTLTMSSIAKEKMGNATSLFSLMRNLGGSVGIAMVATMLARRTQVHTNLLGANIHAYSSQAQQALEDARNLFMSRGSDFYTATQQAYRAIWGSVLRQSSMVAFVDVFRALALVFLLAVPLVLLMRRLKNGARPDPGATH